MNKTVLVLNAGSSSVKFTVYTSDGGRLTTRYNAQIEQLGSQPHSLAKDAQGQVVEEHRWKSRGDDDHRYALERLSNWLDPLLDEAGLIGVGHRVVHGGPEYSAPTLITEQVVARLLSYVPHHELYPARRSADGHALRRSRPRCAALSAASERHEPQQVQDLLYKHSGLLGMSALSNDMRALLASDDPHARQAFDYFVYRMGREPGALTAALGV